MLDIQLLKVWRSLKIILLCFFSQASKQGYKIIGFLHSWPTQSIPRSSSRICTLIDRLSSRHLAEPKSGIPPWESLAMGPLHAIYSSIQANPDSDSLRFASKKNLDFRSTHITLGGVIDE